MKRGEIWTVSGAQDYAGKPRPVVIVQADEFGETPSVSVCPLTSHAIEAPLFRVEVQPSPENGLRQPSHAMADKVTTVPRAKLGRRIGVLAPETMAPVNRAMMVFLGIAGR